MIPQPTGPYQPGIYILNTLTKLNHKTISKIESSGDRETFIQWGRKCVKHTQTKGVKHKKGTKPKKLKEHQHQKLVLYTFL